MTPSVYDVLLEVQDHDSAVDRLRHRRRSLPELAELASVRDELTVVERAFADVAGQRDAVAAVQRRREDELAQVESRIEGLERRMYSGQVNVPRELQAMQADVDALRRRRSSLEDEVLETMAEREPLDAEVATLEQRRVRLNQRAAQLQDVVAGAQAEIDADLDKEMEAREVSAAALPPDLFDKYEALRAKLDGVGAARLVNGRCGGCHLALPATELDRIRREPPDTLIVCDQCGRILVR
jgi:predicted  nucleic acid-binding Zn-ribbon protein